MTRARLRAALLVALVVLPALGLLAQAAPPSTVAGTPHDPLGEVADVAISARGAVAAAALAPPFSREAAPTASNPNAPAKCAPTDLQVYDFRAGATWRAPLPSLQTAPVSDTTGCTVEPHGRSHVALSADGRALVTLGRNRTASDANTHLSLSYHHVGDATAWNASTARPDTTHVRLTGTAVALLVSADGSRVVVAHDEGTTYRVRGYLYDGRTLASAFTYAPSCVCNVTSLAGSRDLSTVVVGASIAENAETHGVVVLIPFNEGRATHTYYDRSGLDTPIHAVGVSADGSRYVAGGVGGALFAFENRGASTPEPKRLDLGEGNVSRIAVSGDGSRMGAAAGANLTHFDYTRAEPDPLWRYQAPFNLTDLAYNGTGRLVVAGVDGLGAVGLGDANATPFWTLPGDDARVAVDDAGAHAVLAARVGASMKVSLLNITRSLFVTHADGSDTVPAKSTGADTPVAFEVEVSNDGAAPEEVRFELGQSADVVLVADPPIVRVDPDETATVRLLVTPLHADPGQMTFNATAVATTSGARDNVTLSILVEGRTDVRLVYSGETEFVASPGVPQTVRLGVVNEGNKATAVGVRATQSLRSGWNLTVEPASFTLPAGKQTTVVATISPPADAPNGTANVVTFALEGQDVSGSVAITLRVNPSVGSSIDVLGRARLVEPGRSVLYNLTVLNNGTLPREYEILHAVNATKNWFAEVEPQRFRLDPGQTETVEVRVFAPDDATPDDRAMIEVTARTVPELPNETAVASSVKLFGIGTLPPTPSTPEDEDAIPAPGVMLTALVLVALVALRRRPSR